MRKHFLKLIAIVLTLGILTACSNNQMGTAGGAAIGGIAGYGLTGGSALGTAVGAVGGGLLGNATVH